MNEIDLHKIKKQIDQKIKKTIQSIQEYKESAKPISPENAIGRISRMDAINNKAVVEAALKNAEDKLQKLQKVQKEIFHKNFGICIRCKHKIPIGRLMIIPESKKCVHCS